MSVSGARVGQVLAHIAGTGFVEVEGGPVDPLALGGDGSLEVHPMNWAEGWQSGNLEQGVDDKGGDEQGCSRELPHTPPKQSVGAEIFDELKSL